MKNIDGLNQYPLMILMAGAKGAVASTVAVAASILNHCPELIVPYLTTSDKSVFQCLSDTIHIAGWDAENSSLVDAVSHHGVLSPQLWKPYQTNLSEIPIKLSPNKSADLKTRIDRIAEDISYFRSLNPESLPVLVNLLPAASCGPLDDIQTLEDLYSAENTKNFPDLAYVMGAVLSGVPVVNFTPNPVEIPVVCREADNRGVPICGKDGKTGQTYLKVVLASALKARCLKVDGWYSLNILGNDDGKNLMNPDRAAGKVANKTQLLDEILGYPVGEKYGCSTHKVVIDYYPPRGDAKEAWDVIDFNGLFGLPMSIRINFQCRDSILAAPLVIDLARWMALLGRAGHKGLVPELGFYFKKPMGDTPPVSFEEQMTTLEKLEKECGSMASEEP
ncbi:MAG: inositol-3-phosphate synthase [Desulfobacterales bacterium]